MINLNKPMDLTGRTVIVTGAAQGIGRAICDLSSAQGANLVMVDRNEEHLALAAADFPSATTLPLVGDVVSADFALDCVQKSAERFGAVHGLVNNAAIIRPAMFEKMTMDQWQDVLSVNLTGCYVMMQAVGRHMLERARENPPQPLGTTGSIVNISATGGKRGAIGQANYAAAKSGLFGLTMTGAVEWAKYGIRCNSVGFGSVVTQMTEVIRSEKFIGKMLARIPLARFADPKEAAGLVVFLLSNAATYITGENMTVSGGLHMQP